MDIEHPAPLFLAVDFYSGAGGTTRGLLDAGGYVIAGIDKDESCRKTYEHNNLNTTLDLRAARFLGLDMFPATGDYPDGQQGDVKEKLNQLIPHYRQLAPDAPLLFAICAPCQAFTRFVQRNLSEERSGGRDRDQNLLMQTLGFIKEFRPDMVLSENVISIKKGSYRDIWMNFQKELGGLGYAVGDDDVCASRFGIAQRRRRSILMALKDSDAGQRVPIPQEDPDEPQRSVKQAIGHLPPLQAGGSDPVVNGHACRDLHEINRQRLASVKPGESNKVLSDSPYGDISLPCHNRLSEKKEPGFSDVYTRMAPDRPAPTITTRFHSVSNGRFGHYDEEQVRGLSLREGALIQSFDEGYEFFASGMDKAAIMIGNAVPPKLSAYMATWLYGQWFSKQQKCTAGKLNPATDTDDG